VILRRLPDSRFSEVLPAWNGRIAVLLGGGPSLTMEQVELVREERAADRVRVVAINDSYLVAPWADALYAADAHWHESHRSGVAKPKLDLKAEDVAQHFAAFKGQKCSIQNQLGGLRDDATHVLRNFHGKGTHGKGLSNDRGALVTGRHSGYQALNLVILAGAATAILLGYDGKPNSEGATHWHGGHETPPASGVWSSIQGSWRDGQNAIKATGVRVVNCSPGSYIGAFEKLPLEQALGLATV
jgi:hypothetical protein